MKRNAFINYVGPILKGSNLSLDFLEDRHDNALVEVARLLLDDTPAMDIVNPLTNEILQKIALIMNAFIETKAETVETSTEIHGKKKKKYIKYENNPILLNKLAEISKLNPCTPLTLDSTQAKPENFANIQFDADKCMFYAKHGSIPNIKVFFRDLAASRFFLDTVQPYIGHSKLSTSMRHVSDGTYHNDFDTITLLLDYTAMKDILDPTIKRNLNKIGLLMKAFLETKGDQPSLKNSAFKKYEPLREKISQLKTSFAQLERADFDNNHTSPAIPTNLNFSLNPIAAQIYRPRQEHYFNNYDNYISVPQQQSQPSMLPFYSLPYSKAYNSNTLP